ncbi:MAG: carbon monoxide dehydrogenase [Dehalococcoidia bacterium]|nr:carbon monoxide dehydrogenase [Dehalococcoidia bacterium]
MTLPKFEYLAPTTLAEACALLAKHQEKARVLAGGTDLVPQMKKRAATPQYVIGLKNVSGLDYIEFDKTKGLRIGALATLNAVLDSPVVKSNYPVLAEAIGRMATVQVRNLGTVGGNLCNASPAADSGTPLLVLDARMKVTGPKGERTIPLEAFFKCPGQCTMEPGEILTEIQVPPPPPKSGAVFLKLARTKDGICQEARIALGSVAPTPMRAHKAEEMLKGKKLDSALIEKAALAASQEARPISDIRSSAEYRVEMVKVLTRNGLTQAMERAKAG